MSKKYNLVIDTKCEECKNLICICEGDHICLECGDTPLLILDDYCATEDYWKCGGKNYGRV